MVLTAYCDRALAMMSGRQETAGYYRLCPRELPDTASYQAGRKEAECVNTAPHTSLIQALMDEDAAAVLREGKRGKYIANIKLRFPAGLGFLLKNKNKGKYNTNHYWQTGAQVSSNRNQPLVVNLYSHLKWLWSSENIWRVLG